MTELVFILDRSGSMSGLEADTIGGFNSLIEKQLEEPEKTLVTTVLFNDMPKVVHDRVPLEQVSGMTKDDYRVYGCTALLDAVGSTMHRIAMVHHYARVEDRPEKTLFVIMTDGMENASKHYTYERVQKMIGHEQEKYGWEFLFLAANIDAAAEAKRFNISPDRAVDYKCDSAGTALSYDVLADEICSLRCGTGVRQQWKRRIEEDCRLRGEK